MTMPATRVENRELWSRLGAAAPRIALRRTIRGFAFAVVGLTGFVWLLLIGYTLRRPEPAVSLMCLVHLVAVLLAAGPSRRSRDELDGAESRLRLLVRRYNDRYERLRTLQRALFLELAFAVVQGLATAYFFESPPRLGPAFMVGFMSLWVVMPLARVARAQRTESERLNRLI
jgi:hypothetical protein